MQTENVHSVARQMTQGAAQLDAQLEVLQSAIQKLDIAWQGGRKSEKFISEIQNTLNHLKVQQDFLAQLAMRVEREANEWEEIDQRGRGGLGSIRVSLFDGSYVGSLPFSGGEAGYMSVIPMGVVVSVGLLISNLPQWLSSFLNRLFPPPVIVSPLPTNPSTTSSETSGFGELLKKSPPAESPVATASAQPITPVQSPDKKYDTYYDILAKSQGTLYGSAACFPTSISMVMDYYHAKNSDFKTATPKELVDMLDPGDGSSAGIGLDKLENDVAELGYKSTPPYQSNMDDLSTKLKEGPVIVNMGVSLISQPDRDIQGAGNTNHSMLVKGINADSVVVNDPWSGAEKIYPRETFEKMWSKGQNYLIIVRPEDKPQ